MSVSGNKTASNVITIKNINQFNTAFNKGTHKVLYFWAEWDDTTKQITTVLNELSKDEINIIIISIDAENENNESIIDKYNIESVPTIILTSKNKTENVILQGFKIPTMVDKIKQFSQQATTYKKLNTNTTVKTTDDNKETESKEALDKRLHKLINAAPIMIFMKGLSYHILV